MLTTLWYNAVTTLYVAHNVIYNVLTTSCVAHNVRYNVVTTLYVVTRLFCRLPEALSQRCVWRSNELITTLRDSATKMVSQRCHDVPTMSRWHFGDFFSTLLQRSYNVVKCSVSTTFLQRLRNVLVHFSQCCHDFATTSCDCFGYVLFTFLQCYLNIITTFL